MLSLQQAARPAFRQQSHKHGSGASRAVAAARPRRMRQTVAVRAQRQEDGQTGIVESAAAMQSLGMPLLTATSVAFILLADSASAAEATSQSQQLQQLQHAELYQLASSDDFWLNMERYVRFAMSSALGMAYIILKPLYDLLRKPQTAIPLIIGIYLSVKGLEFTLNAMLGINDPTASYD